MTRELLEKYCLGKNGAIKEYPFDETTAVFKVGNKMFALIDEISTPPRINLKCDPYYALELRAMYKSVSGGYHMNKKYWITMLLDGTVSEAKILDFLDMSYDLIDGNV